MAAYVAALKICTRAWHSHAHLREHIPNPKPKLMSCIAATVIAPVASVKASRCVPVLIPIHRPPAPAAKRHCLVSVERRDKIIPPDLDTPRHARTLHNPRSLSSRRGVAVKLAPRVSKVSSPRARAAGKVMAMAEEPGKKKILRENEKEAWLSEMEKEGANPFKDPMAITAIVGITVPFVILGIAGALGYIGQ